MPPLTQRAMVLPSREFPSRSTCRSSFSMVKASLHCYSKYPLSALRLNLLFDKSNGIFVRLHWKIRAKEQALRAALSDESFYRFDRSRNFWAVIFGIDETAHVRIEIIIRFHAFDEVVKERHSHMRNNH